MTNREIVKVNGEEIFDSGYHQGENKDKHSIGINRQDHKKSSALGATRYIVQPHSRKPQQSHVRDKQC